VGGREGRNGGWESEKVEGSFGRRSEEIVD
jgi:hypothetical protein